MTVFSRKVKPYDAPGSLDELAGPAGGVLDLPHHLYWGRSPPWISIHRVVR